jgi:hypothetical protein
MGRLSVSVLHLPIYTIDIHFRYTENPSLDGVFFCIGVLYNSGGALFSKKWEGCFFTCVQVLLVQYLRLERDT